MEDSAGTVFMKVSSTAAGFTVKSPPPVRVSEINDEVEKKTN